MSEIDNILTEFLKSSRANCALLFDKTGNLITRQGTIKSFNADTVGALVAGAFAATIAVAQMLGETDFPMLLQGEKENMHVALVAECALVVVIFGDDTSVGMVQTHSALLALKLEDSLLR